MKSERTHHALIPAAATVALLCICIVFSSIAAAVETQPEAVQPAVQSVSAASAEAAAEAAAEPAVQAESAVSAAQLQDAQGVEHELRAYMNRQPDLTEEEVKLAMVPDDLVLLDYFTATAYCTTGRTATGTYTTVGRTLAVNPSVIPYGTHLWLYLDDGTLVGDFYAEDTGSNMAAYPYVIDIYKGADSYDECIQWGAQHVTAYVRASDIQ